MTTPDYTSLVAGQRAYFLSGKTRPAAWRVAQLNAVKAMISEPTLIIATDTLSATRRPCRSASAPMAQLPSGRTT